MLDMELQDLVVVPLGFVLVWPDYSLLCPFFASAAIVYWKHAVCFLFQRSSGFTDGFESQIRLDLENGTGISKAHKGL